MLVQEEKKRKVREDWEVDLDQIYEVYVSKGLERVGDKDILWDNKILFEEAKKNLNPLKGKVESPFKENGDWRGDQRDVFFLPIKQCFACYGLYVDCKDREYLRAYKRLHLREKKMIQKAVYCLKRLRLPMPPDVLNACGFEMLSAGFCSLCIACSNIGKKKRLQQKLEGNFDCFGKALGSCDQIECSHRDLCIVDLETYYLWLERVKILEEAGQYTYEIIYR